MKRANEEEAFPRGGGFEPEAGAGEAAGARARPVKRRSVALPRVRLEEDEVCARLSFAVQNRTARRRMD
jgi:hypothetical protein